MEVHDRAEAELAELKHPTYRLGALEPPGGLPVPEAKPSPGFALDVPAGAEGEGA